jgi:hypothetical protein
MISKNIVYGHKILKTLVQAQAQALLASYFVNISVNTTPFTIKLCALESHK